MGTFRMILFNAACLVMPAGAALAGAPAAAPPAKAQAARTPFVKSEAAATVKALASDLEKYFVFPDQGKAYAERLRSQLASGAYDSFPDADAFAKKVTAELQAVHKDGHLMVHVLPDETDSPQVQMMNPEGESGIIKDGWIAPGVAYISFRLFPGNEKTLAALRQFLDSHKDAKTLIIDQRENHGGGLAEMNVLFPRIFAKPTVLVDMDTRLAVEQEGHAGPEDPFTRKVPGPAGVVRREHYVVPAKPETPLSEARIFVLTSHTTGSAAEHFALAMKRTHRATLVGQATHGAGHYGGMVPIDGPYAAFIPVGRTFDPDTNQGWEGTGVKPDVEVPADQALDEALKLAGVQISGEAALAALH